MTRPGRCGHARARRPGALLAVSFLATALLPGAARPQPAVGADGQRTFEAVCVACHTVGAGDRIGPDLQGVVERRDADWLRRFIAAPDRVRAADDPVAAANLARFGVPMPNLGLTDEQVDAVIAWLAAAETVRAARPAPFVPTLAASVLALIGLTVAGLRAGAKRVEVRS